MALRVYRVQSHLSVVEGAALDAIGEDLHRRQATVFIVARNMRDAAEHLDAAHVASPKAGHMELAMGIQLDAILAAGYLHEEHQIVVYGSPGTLTAVWRGLGLYEPIGRLVSSRTEGQYAYALAPLEG